MPPRGAQVLLFAGAAPWPSPGCLRGRADHYADLAGAWLRLMRGTLSCSAILTSRASGLSSVPAALAPQVADPLMVGGADLSSIASAYCHISSRWTPCNPVQLVNPWLGLKIVFRRRCPTAIKFWWCRVCRGLPPTGSDAFPPGAGATAAARVRSRVRSGVVGWSVGASAACC